MGLGQAKKRKVFLNLNGGMVEHTINGKKEQFSYVEGRLISIYDYERAFNGQKMKYWYIDMEDDDGTIYSIGFNYSSGLFKTIILSLASDESLNPNSIIRVQPYMKDKYTKAVVWSDGVKLDWVIKEMPPLKEIKVGNKTIKDDTDRMKLIAVYVSKINMRVKE